MTALSGLRVLDLTDVKGALCAKLFGDMGADVVKVEPPGGDPTRYIGPYLGDSLNPDRSLLFWFYNTSKRGVTLDIEQQAGRALLKRLMKTSDILIESFAPGVLDRFGLGYEETRKTNPSLIYTSITPFGHSGPYKAYESCEIVAEALGGMMFTNGFQEDPPLQAMGLQAYHSTAFFAAIGIMSALWARETIGEGQWIDVSVQEAVAGAVEHVAPFYHQGLGIQKRQGSLHWSKYFRVAKCRDGYVMHCSLGDWTSLVEWVKGDGKGQDLDEPQWEDLTYRKENAEHLFDVLDEWAKEYTVADLMEGAQMRRIPYAMVRPPEALIDDPQLKHRGFFTEVEHPELDRTIRYPGGPVHFNTTPWRIARRPPLLGEHNRVIYEEELGLDTNEIVTLRDTGVI